MLINDAYAATPELAKAKKMSKSEEEHLKEACEGFEAIFLHKMLQTMRNATIDGGLLKKSNGEKIFTDFLDFEFAQSASKQSTNGLADLMFNQLKGSLKSISSEEMLNFDRSLKGLSL